MIYSQMAWNLIKSLSLGIWLMEKFRWEDIGLAAVSCEQNVPGVCRVLGILLSKIYPYNSHFFGIIIFLPVSPGSRPWWAQSHEWRLSLRQPADLGGRKKSDGGKVLVTNNWLAIHGKTISSFQLLLSTWILLPNHVSFGGLKLPSSLLDL